MTQAQVADYRDTMCRLYEVCRTEGLSIHTPILYDELLRREWYRRSSRRDESFDFGKECKETVERIWVSAKQTIQRTLVACGVESGGSKGAASGGSSAHPGLTAAVSEAEQLRRQAQAAGDKLAHQQAKFLEQQKDMLNALNDGQYRSDTGANANGKGKSKGKGKKRKGDNNGGNWSKKQNTGGKWNHNNNWKAGWK